MGATVFIMSPAPACQMQPLTSGFEVLAQQRGLPNASNSTSADTVRQRDHFDAQVAAAKWDIARDKLMSWTDWSGSRSGADIIYPNDAAIGAALDVVNELESVAAPIPVLSFATDGEVVFEWEKGDGYAAISITNDGDLIGYLREPGSELPLSFDEPFDPLVLTAFLNRIGAFA